MREKLITRLIKRLELFNEVAWKMRDLETWSEIKEEIKELQKLIKDN